MGGLGNQLFQVNYGYQLMKLGYDIRFVDNLTKKSFLTKRVLSWNIHPYVLNDIVKVETHTESNLIPVLFAKVNIFNQWSNYMDCQIYSDLPKNIFGYFQCKNFQENVYFNEDIHSSLLATSVRSQIKIAVHLRFGDAPNLSRNMKYYTKALKNLSDSKVCVCTDDQVFAKKFLQENNFNNYFFSNGSLMDDFKILANAEIVISAPSTFSFWAVKLSKVISEVYLPKEFYATLGSPSNFSRTHVI